MWQYGFFVQKGLVRDMVQVHGFDIFERKMIDSVPLCCYHRNRGFCTGSGGTDRRGVQKKERRITCII